MFSHSMTGYSMESSSAAVSAALGMAGSSGEDVQSVHIFVESVSKVGEGWKAIVRVIIEPKLENTFDPKLEHDKEEHDREHERDKKHEEELAAHPEMHYEFEDDFEGIERNLEAEDIFIHIPPRYEAFYDELSVKYGNRVHKMDHDDIKEHLRDHMLDITFYEATHWDELQKKHEEDERRMAGFVKDFKPKNEPGLELTLDPVNKLKESH